MKKTFFLFVLSFLAGILCMQLLGDYIPVKDGMMSEYQLYMFANQKIDKIDLFWNILWERGKLYFILTILLCTPVKKIFPVLSGAFISFTTGMFGALCIILYGFKGVLLFLCSVFPQGIFYVLTLFFLIRLKKPVIFRNGKKVVSYIFSILLIISIFMVGCIMEATFGMELLKMCAGYVVG